MRLHKINHLSLLPENDSAKGMLNKAQSHVTFGEIDEDTLTKLLKKKARLMGEKKLDDAFFKAQKIKSFEELAKLLLEGKTELKKLGIKPVFRLKPPSKGYEKEGIKKPFKVGGVSGYRASEMNALIKKMI